MRMTTEKSCRFLQYGLALLLVALIFQSNINGDADVGGGAAAAASAASFAGTSGTRFVMNERPFYANGFNAYWMMYVASVPSETAKVSAAFRQASIHGLNLARTWAFSDGGSCPLQVSPGVYNQAMFKALDLVISEAGKHGVYLILSLANQWNDYGGRNQYVEWARQQGGQNLTSDDDFFRNDLVKTFYKNHVKAVLTRVNTITGVAYKDDPTIFAWELINEPQCQSDLSGATLQAWIKEMAGYVKSLDVNHMVEVGMEGFYGASLPDRQKFNPGYMVGTDFIANHLLPVIDFATIHAYPDQWKSGSSEQEQTAFLSSWIESHTEDCSQVLKKPLLVAEFGKSPRSPGFSTAVRDAVYSTVYDAVYSSAQAGGSCAGATFWQLMVEGMDNMKDGYEVVFSESPSTAAIISRQSQRLTSLPVNNINGVRPTDVPPSAKYPNRQGMAMNNVTSSAASTPKVIKT